MKLILTILAVLLFARALGHAARLPSGHRIVGGVEVDISQHPYQLTYQPQEAHNCGAAIISRKWAITAAHCTGNNSPNQRLGAGSNWLYTGTFYTISKIIPHPDYNSETNDYDIALLKIEGEFQYRDNVQPINLPERELQPGEFVNVTGWGRISEEQIGDGNLLGVTIPIVDRKTCEELYAKVQPITSRMICAGQLKIGGKDACQGDSGGPMSANNTLYGIVSWGRGCGRPEYPGVYTNVAALNSWIVEVTGINIL